MVLPNHHEEAGQALIELALILPLFFFAIFVYLLTLSLCRRAMVLQNAAGTSAQVAALVDKSAKSNFPNQAIPEVFLRVETRPRIQQTVETLAPWRSFRGVSVLKTPGGLAKSEVSSVVFPRRLFGRLLPALQLSYEAEYPKEPSIPEEK
jgi:hypothetical protein